MITMKIDASQALAKFTGIPESVRRSLRGVIPDLTKRLGAAVDANLDAGLKSRNRLVVKKEMVEDSKSVSGVVTTVSTKEPYLLPLWLESGTAPHEIAARNASALFFFWERMGKNVAFKRVMHPGFAGIHYTQNAFDAMSGEIRDRLTRAVIEGAKAA